MAAGETSSPPRRFRRTFTVGAVLLVAVAALATATLAMQAGRVVPGTHVGDVDLSGLTRQAAADVLATTYETGLDTVAILSLDQSTHTLSAADAAIAVDIPGSVERAFAIGRSGIGAYLARPFTLLRTTKLAPVFQYDRDVVDTFVADVATTHDRAMVDGSFAVAASAPFVRAEIPVVGIAVDRDPTRNVVLAQLTGVAASPTSVPHARTDPQYSPAHVRQLAGALTAVFTDATSVQVHSSAVPFRPAELAALIDVFEESTPDGQLIPRIRVDAARLPERLITAAEQHVRDPAPGRFTSPRRPSQRLTTLGDVTVEPVAYPVVVVPPVAGRTVDRAYLASQLETAMTNGLTAIVLQLAAVEPPDGDVALADLAPTHLLATFTSPLIAGQARNLNITRLANTLDDAVIMPGEQFSINAVSGPRLCSKGYVPAGTIVGGELVDACGGGVSQVGTTVLNAAFFAGVQLDAFTPHSFYIGRYAPGREATLSYPRLDVAFTNTTDGVLHLRAFTTRTSLTVSLYGRPAHRAVSARHGARAAVQTFSEERRLDTSLPRGTERVLQSGGNGFTITVTRVVVALDGQERREQFTTRYLPQRRIVAYNPAPAPAPTPPATQPPPAPGEPLPPRFTDDAPADPSDEPGD